MGRIKVSPEKKILDVTCGGRSIWFDKHNPAAIYCDRRKCHYEKACGEDQSVRTVDVDPDVICDFTDLPFDNNQFQLVVFDPPHIPKTDSNENMWMLKAYGSLEDGWQEMLHDGFHECMRVLKPGGCLFSNGAKRKSLHRKYGMPSERNHCLDIIAEPKAIHSGAVL